MKKYILYSIIVMVLLGCEEIIPEYLPFYGEPTIASEISYTEILSVADDGTVWAISKSDDDYYHVYWIKDGLIRSQRMFENSAYLRGYGTVGDKFYYIQRRELIIHSTDSVMVIGLPVTEDHEYDYTFELFTTETLVVLFSYETESRYWILDGDSWIQKPISSELFWSFLDSFNRGRFRNEYVLCFNGNTSESVIVNMETSEYSPIDPTYTDEYGNEHSLSIDYNAEPNCFDQQGNLYVISDYGELFRTNRATQSLEFIPVSISGVDSDDLQIEWVVVSSNDDIWVTFQNTSTYDHGIYLLGSNSPQYNDDLDYSLSNGELFADSNGRLWIISNKIFGYDTNGRVTEYEASLNIWGDNFFIKEDDSGAVWVGQPNFGLYRFANGSWTSYNQYFNIF